MKETFLIALTPMLTLALCILIGYLLRRFSILPDNAGKVMAKLETWVFLPSLTFSTMVRYCTVDTLTVHGKNLLLSFFGVWAIATLLFVVLAIVWEAHWQVFVYAIPASLVVLLVFNAIWGRPRRIFLITGGLIASLVLTAYIATLAQNLWQLFLLLPPTELLVLLSRYLFKKK